MSANVRDIEALREFRARLISFSEEVDAALQSMQMEMQRTQDWMSHDRPHYWTQQMRRAYDLVASTRSALETCQMRSVAGHRPSCIEEKQAHAQAKRRLRHCQDQIENVKRWSVKLDHDANEFRARLSRLGRMLESDIPEALAFLERTITILEEYAEISPPSNDSP